MSIPSISESPRPRSSKAPRLEVFGTEGTISLVTKESKDPKLPYPTALPTLYAKRGWRTVPIRDSPDLVRRWKGKIMPWTVPLKGLASIESLLGHVDEFLTCILDDREPAVPGEEGRKVIEIIQGIYKSSRDGKVVEFPLKAG